MQYVGWIVSVAISIAFAFILGWLLRDRREKAKDQALSEAFNVEKAKAEKAINDCDDLNDDPVVAAVCKAEAIIDAIGSTKRDSGKSQD